jgi:hypothetical protein
MSSPGYDPVTGQISAIYDPAIEALQARATQAQINAFLNSQAYRDFQKRGEGGFGTMDMYNSPYFGEMGSGSIGRAQDAAFEAWLAGQNAEGSSGEKKMAMPALPTGWENLGAQQKIDWFNQNSVAPDQLLAAGVSQADIDWMKSQGYAGMPPITTGELPPGATYLADGTQLPSGWDSFGAQQKINWFNQQGITPEQLLESGVSQADIDWMGTQGYKDVSTNPANLTAQQQAAGAGLTLPAGWDSFNAQQKINWFNTNKVAPDKLLQSGVSQGDIDWMKGQGYTGGVTPTTAKTTTIDPSQSTLSPNFSPYVYNMLAKGEAAANLPYQPFTGQRFAGPSPLQQQAFQGLSNLQLPAEFQAGSQLAALAGISAGNLGNYAPGRFANFYQTPQEYSPETMSTGLGDVKSVQDYMNPYQQNVIDIQAREARRQADIGRNAEQARLAQAGAYGGSRQAIMEAERQRNLGTQIGDIQEKGLQSAYDRAQAQRVAESQLGLEAQKGTEQSRQYGYGQGMNAAQLGAQYGLEGARQTEASRQFGANLGLQSLNPMLSAASTLGGLGQQQFGAGIQGLNAQLAGGATQQALAQQPLDFGYQQFQESVKFPYQQATYMQSLLGGLPLQAAPYSSNQGQSGMFSGLQGALAGLALYNAFNPTATPK